MTLNHVLRFNRTCRLCCRTFTLSACCNKQKKVRPKLEGEALEKHLKRKNDLISKHLHYLGQVYYVVDKFTEERGKELQAKEDVAGKQHKILEKEREVRKEALMQISKDNEEMAKKRAIRVQLEKEEENKRISEGNLKRLQERLDDIEEKRGLVLRAIDESKNWITPENLDEKIQEALENEVNYNFALTSSGEKIYSTHPPGNFGTEWKSPGPSAFTLGGYKPGEGEWDLVFRRYQKENFSSENKSQEKKIADPTTS